LGLFPDDRGEFPDLGKEGLAVLQQNVATRQKRGPLQPKIVALGMKHGHSGVLKLEIRPAHAHTSRRRQPRGDRPKITREADLKPIAAWCAGFTAGAACRVLSAASLLAYCANRYVIRPSALGWNG
jgi:hypothetical protein